MKSIEEVMNLLDDIGIVFQSKAENSGLNKFLTTFWKTKNHTSIKIVIFLNHNRDWINFSAKIGNSSIFQGIPNLYLILLRLNLSIVGPKFCLDTNSNIYCNTELFATSSNSESLKKALLQMVNAISLFNKEIDKKQN